MSASKSSEWSQFKQIEDIYTIQIKALENTVIELRSRLEAVRKLLDYYDCECCEAQLDGISCEDCSRILQEKLKEAFKQ